MALDFVRGSGNNLLTAQQANNMHQSENCTVKMDMEEKNG